ncbi:hypothetical protein XENTR_v10020312 [Xenopus tropicalis]|nr:hypothetical protein XENTR_v10020312 [Xenopus tropicalis]
MAALVICLCFLLGVIPVGAGTQVCESCPGALRNSSQVSQLCRAAPKARTLGRCCLGHMDGSDVIIGLDLWNCSLAQLDPTLHLTQAAVVLDLSSNPLRDLPSEFFRGLLGLQYVALPAELSCPGGNNSWENVNVTSAVRVCQDQRSSCNSTSEWGEYSGPNMIHSSKPPFYVLQFWLLVAQITQHRKAGKSDTEEHVTQKETRNPVFLLTEDFHPSK